MKKEQSLASKLNEISSQIKRFKNNPEISHEEVISYWRSDFVQDLKEQLDEVNIMEPPVFKRAVGMVGDIADFAFDGYEGSKFKEYTA